MTRRLTKSAYYAHQGEVMPNKGKYRSKDRYVHFGVDISCLVANLGHLNPFYAHSRVSFLVLYQALGRKTKH